MKNLELQNFGVHEMDAKEMRDIDGGFWWVGRPNLLKAYLAAKAVGDFVDDFAAGFNGEEVNKGYRQVTGKSL